MKNTIIIFAIAFCMMQNLYSQDNINIGLKGGLNIASITNTGGSGSSSNFAGSYSVKNRPRLLPHFGLYSEFKINEIFSFQPELLFSMKGYSNKTEYISGGYSVENHYKLTLSYIDIPLQMRFNVSKFHFLVGPYVGFLAGASSTYKSEVVNGPLQGISKSKSTSKVGLNSPEAGIYLGGGYELDNGLSLGIRWCRGFSDIIGNNNNAGSNNSNSVFQFSLGYKLASF